MPPLRYARNKHNEHLVRAREVQGRVVTLLVRWKQTGRQKFRDATLNYIRQIGQWEYWSWVTWRQGDPSPDAIFDLSYGENSATLAIAYDWLHDSLSTDERKLFVRIARERPFLSGLKHARPGGAWWFGTPDCNWNTVCAGGLGMLCLAMYEDVPEARTLLPRCDESIGPFMRLLNETDGGWPEGIGYWNYGMRYAFMYLLSCESATGKRHPLMGLKGVRQTLSFPLDFCPHGQPCSFSDVNKWRPMPFHYAAAARLKQDDVVQALDTALERTGVAPGGAWPNAAEWLLLHPDTRESRPARARGGVKLYRGIDWGIIADTMPEPSLYMAVRGGTTKVPHGHRDLLSFHCVAGGERLITDVKPAEYLDSTFSPRRNELFEMAPVSKNTILINGVGIAAGSELNSTRVLSFSNAQGLRLDATSAMGDYLDNPAASFCCRLILLLAGRAFLIVDRVVLPHTGQMESRMHTFAPVKTTRSGALISGRKQKLRVAYSCTTPAILRTAASAPTSPSTPSSTILRWCTNGGLNTDMTMATLLSPGAGTARIAVEQTRNRLRISASGPQFSESIEMNLKLRPTRT